MGCVPCEGGTSIQCSWGNVRNGGTAKRGTNSHPLAGPHGERQVGVGVQMEVWAAPRNPSSQGR